MKVYFGKISDKYDTSQIEEGFYRAPQKSWYNGIDIGDYAFVIGNGKIQLWKASQWGVMDNSADDRLDFEIVFSDLNLKVKDFIAFKYFKLSIDLIVKTTRSTGAEKKAFFQIDLDSIFNEDKLLDRKTYSNKSNFRKIIRFREGEELLESYDIQIQKRGETLFLNPIINCDLEVLDRFIDNTAHIGNGQSQKDKTLSVVKAKGNLGVDLSSRISIQEFYDAFMCEYQFKEQDVQYWVVNGFDEKRIDYMLKNDCFVMQFQYGVQRKSEVTNQIKRAKKIRAGDQVLLFNKNRYFAKSTFIKNDPSNSSIEMTLSKQISESMKHEKENLVYYTDAPCYYEDLKSSNGFDGEWGQRLKISGWENVSENGIKFEGIAKNLNSSITTDTIMQLKDNSFFNTVVQILEENDKNYQTVMKLNSIKNLLLYKKQIILQGPPGTGKTFTAKNIAKDIVGSEDNEQIEIIQFHPSYTYEDFVRGITAKGEGAAISYETENKLLARIAEKAKNNLDAVNKDVEEFNVESHITNLLNEFSETIQDKIEEEGEYEITESVSIIAVEEDAFRYTGKWKTSQRMKFKDLVTLQINKVSSRQELKIQKNISGLARQHSSYFFKVLEKFRGSFKDQLDRPIPQEVEKPVLKYFVLIIDEINRANLPSVLGELIYALEYRGESVKGIYDIDGDNSITIPDNLLIIGTMNTADRSVGHIDYAIKRRFSFYDLLPDKEVVTEGKARELFDLVSGLFLSFDGEVSRNSDYLAPDFDFKDVQIGHSYFILNSEGQNEQSKELKMRLHYEILPLLKEYIKDGILLDTEETRSKLEEIERFEC